MSGVDYDYDLFVIGGGSGGLAAVKEARKFGKSVAVADYIVPTPIGTTWGIGGTCVNVGCIPKKLMHTAGILGDAVEDAEHFGWSKMSPTHSWTTLRKNVQHHISGLNDGYIADLKKKKIDYYNALATFTNADNAHEITLSKPGQDTITKTAERIIIACGGRPNYPDCKGAKECCITSDDIFSLQKDPGEKVLVIGASYVALECAGFLSAIGHDVTVMVRSILLRGFDQEMAGKIQNYMKVHKTKFLMKKVPVTFEKVKEDVKEEKGSTTKDMIKVTWKDTKPKEGYETKGFDSGCFDTVLVAIGRTPCTEGMGLDKIGVATNKKGKIPVINEQTCVPHIYAIGDVATMESGSLELTPVAIQAGKYLARRLYGGSTKQMDYDLVATTIFTPLEYGCIGLTEDDAKWKYGEDNIEVYHQTFQPLEMSLPERMNTTNDHGFCKLILDLTDNGRIIGFHYAGPNAGEVTQGFGLAMKCGATKADIDDCVGIHPTCAENMTTLAVTKSSGVSAVKEDC